MAPVMTVEEIKALFDVEFPQLTKYEWDAYQLEEVFEMGARMRLKTTERHLRPGGTISGPSMMCLADVAIYCAILGQIGPKSITVTTNLNMNFLRKPPFADLLGEAKILKLGKRLVVSECSLLSVENDELVAHVTATYSIPPNK